MLAVLEKVGLSISWKIRCMKHLLGAIVRAGQIDFSLSYKDLHLKSDLPALYGSIMLVFETSDFSNFLHDPITTCVF